MKYLIEPHFVLRYPVHLLPEVLRELAPRLGRFLNKKIRDAIAYKILRSDAYGPGLFDGMELSLCATGLLDEDGDINYRRLSAYKQSNLPIYSLHGYYENPPFRLKHTYFNLAEYSQHMRKLLRNQVLVASELLGDNAVLIFHAGFIESELYRDKAVQNAVWLLDSVRSLLHEKKVFIALENLEFSKDYLTLGSDPQELKAIVESVGDPYVKMVLDWGHINTRNENAQNFNLVSQAIKLLGKDVIYAHIHYNPCHRLTLKNILYGDHHLPLTRMRKEELVPFAQTIMELMEYTSVKDFGRVHLEIQPRSIFGLITIARVGATWEEQKKSLYLLKNIIDRNVISFEPPPLDFASIVA